MGTSVKERKKLIKAMNRVGITNVNVDMKDEELIEIYRKWKTEQQAKREEDAMTEIKVEVKEKVKEEVEEVEVKEEVKEIKVKEEVRVENIDREYCLEKIRNHNSKAKVIKHKGVLVVPDIYMQIIEHDIDYCKVNGNEFIVLFKEGGKYRYNVKSGQRI